MLWYWILLIVLCAIVIILVCIKIYLKCTTGLCKCATRLKGKTVIVTGANTGIGYEAAQEFARRGARVILACRNLEKGKIARETIVRESRNADVAIKVVDFASLQSVREFASDVQRTESRIDVLVNNAGATNLGDRKSEDGLQLALQVNHFGPFLLTNLLLGLLRKSAPSRIIMVSSIGHKFANINLDDINMQYKWSDNLAYFNSKLCNVAFANELTRRLKELGVSANSLHPGAVKTDINRNMPSLLRIPINAIMEMYGRTAYEGAQTIVYLAVSPEVEYVSGEYFVDCKRSTMSPLARDEQFCRKIWEISERCVNLHHEERRYRVESTAL